MREEIWSKRDSGKLLHLIFRHSGITESRTDICDAGEGLQVAAFRLPKGRTFQAHRHIPRERTIPQTQETWIVLSGRVLVKYYDTDGQPLSQAVLCAGDCSITLDGGHNYESLENWTDVVEVKLGPFVGVSEDKVPI